MALNAPAIGGSRKVEDFAARVFQTSRLEPHVVAASFTFRFLTLIRSIRYSVDNYKLLPKNVPGFVFPQLQEEF